MNALSKQFTKLAPIIRGCVVSSATGTTVPISIPRYYYAAASSWSLQPLASLSFKLNFSTVSSTTTSQLQQKVVLPTTPDTIADEESGDQMAIIFDTRKMPKLKPSIVQRRLAQCKTYEGRERNIRQSPWKLNRICQLAAGLTLEEALTQLQFCPLKNADLVAKVLRRTSNLADIRDGLQISQLEVAECFTTKSVMLRRIKPMGRGRYEDWL